MPFQTPYILHVSLDVDPAKEALFEEVYNTEHIPLVQKVPGVGAVARFKTEELVIRFGGERRTIVLENEAKYHAFYEIESPAVLVSDAWAQAADAGRWPAEVRPFTHNRRHALRRLMISMP